METVLLVESDDFGFVGGINDDETATGLIAAGIEPSFTSVRDKSFRKA